MKFHSDFPCIMNYTHFFSTKKKVLVIYFFPIQYYIQYDDTFAIGYSGRQPLHGECYG